MCGLSRVTSGKLFPSHSGIILPSTLSYREHRNLGFNLHLRESSLRKILPVYFKSLVQLPGFYSLHIHQVSYTDLELDLVLSSVLAFHLLVLSI